MKSTIQLEQNNLKELSFEETKETNGGVFGWDDFLITVAAAAVIQIMADFDNFKKGLSGQPEIK